MTSIKLVGLNYKDNLNNAKKFLKELGNPYSQILIDEEWHFSNRVWRLWNS